MLTDPVPTRRANLVWQRDAGSAGGRDCFAVGELVQLEDRVSFRYFDDDALEVPREQGFEGYDCMPPGDKDNDRLAMKLLRRRLPPSGRGDFGEFLARFGLPADWDYTDLSLLAYTGARRPGDPFSICETFDGFDNPFTYVFDLVDVESSLDACGQLSPGEALEFSIEPEDGRRLDEVLVSRACDGATLGYVNRVQAGVIGRWLTEGKVEASVFRFNPFPKHPRLFVRAEIVPAVASADAAASTVASLAA